MFIKLKFKQETNKAFQLNNGAWIPKAVLNNKGLSDDYYEIEGWFLQSCMNNRFSKDIREKIEGLSELVVKELPENINKKYLDYLEGGLQGNFYMYDSDDRRFEIPDYKNL